MPLPGIEITVQEVKACGHLSLVSGPIRKGTTERPGTAVFHLTTARSYVIRTSGDGGFEARELCLPIRSFADANRYVQFQLRLDPETSSRSVTRASVRSVPRRGNCRLTLSLASTLIAPIGPTRSTSPTMGRV